MRVLGVDPAFANMGLCWANVRGGSVEITDLMLVKTAPNDRKEVRKSSDDLRRARVMAVALKTACVGVQVAVSEVPSGARDAAAARALGIVVGLLAAIDIPLIEVNPLEVKTALTGNKGATKEQMIAAAVRLHPNAPWLRRGGKLTQNNEHLADALATILAGMKTTAFQMALSIQPESPPTRRRIAI